ncbi:MAG: nitrous oxide reductase family maturation protein NosD [candidate division Zixibacteria bacterium]|nr:nitrous oxide reductase family maturation protein NosD [candidate division Zixibacteria bacterium]
MAFHRSPYGSGSPVACILGSLIICFAIWPQASGQAAVLTVTPGGTLRTIGDAVRAAAPHDTIDITAGAYVEHHLVIDKPLNLRGTGWPQITSDDSGDVILIRSSNVSVSGLQVSGATVSFLRENAAIKVELSRHVTVRGNRLLNNFFGVYLAKSDSCEVTGNTIIGRSTDLSVSGNGIHLWYCNHARIDSNAVSGQRDGIYFEFVTHSLITRNRSADNLRYGLHFMFSDSCRYEGNEFTRDGAGVAVMYTNHIQMIANTFSRNWGSAAYGLLLKDIRDSEVRQNKFSQNSVALHMEGSSGIDLYDNVFTDNGWAVKIMANCIAIRFSRNSFTNNTFVVATNSLQTNSTFEENYWSGYRGYDLDRDGFGDVPYRPVSLFSLVVEGNPPALILVRSLLTEVLNLAEKVIPTLTPAALVDRKPLLRPPS